MAMSLKKLADFSGGELITRFAPSPSGWLHLGHVLSALYVWGIARAVGATVILRIEDHDLSRARTEFEQGILSDLEWLGFEPDKGVVTPALASAYRQSDHLTEYAATLADLHQRGLVYGCDCTRADIKRRVESAGEELFYDGHCQDRQLPLDGGIGVRLKVSGKAQTFIDARCGPQVQNPAHQCGDWLVRDRNGHYTYNAAVTIDDIRDRINLIIRGEDLLHATGRQLELRGYLGQSAELTFLHHPLLLDGQVKLSKRDGAMGIRELRGQGNTPSDVWLLATRHANLPALNGLTEACDFFRGLLG